MTIVHRPGKQHGNVDRLSRIRRIDMKYEGVHDTAAVPEFARAYPITLTEIKEEFSAELRDTLP